MMAIIEITLLLLSMSRAKARRICDRNGGETSSAARLFTTHIYTHIYDGLYVRHGDSVKHISKNVGKIANAEHSRDI